MDKNKIPPIHRDLLQCVSDVLANARKNAKMAFNLSMVYAYFEIGKMIVEEGQAVETPKDAVKDPYVLEFLGLPVLPSYSETALESRIIDHLQQFFLELGTGFAFIGRQERFMVDLLFYSRLLHCLVLFDRKIGERKHQDIGQMQMDVRSYDRKMKLPDKNPTAGIVLCADKNNAVVETPLREDNSQLFAGKHETILPSKAALQKLLQGQITEENGGEGE